LELLDKILGATLQTILTDEDSAIVLDMNSFRSGSRPDVADRVCRFHKKQDVTRWPKVRLVLKPRRAGMTTYGFEDISQHIKMPN
jgi:hypothetical protein